MMLMMPLNMVIMMIKIALNIGQSISPGVVVIVTVVIIAIIKPYKSHDFAGSIMVRAIINNHRSAV